MILYAATTNAGKLAEFATSAAADGFDVQPLPGLGELPEPVEDATTFVGNATLKAVAYSQMRPGLLVLSDDSGLCVDALDGAPGVRSARYALDCGFAAPPEGTKDQRNNQCLLARLAALGDATRAAQFVCALVVARDGVVLHRAEGSVAGSILPAPRGDAGFGYDPLFLVPELGLTMAEVPREQKWTISHRGRAFRALMEQLRDSLAY
jgi:XTP/dITP diphosphohydrolase